VDVVELITFSIKAATNQGCSDGGYIGMYTPKISPNKLFMG